MTVSAELSNLGIKGNIFIDINNDGLLDILTSTMNEVGKAYFRRRTLLHEPGE